jgi:hypothetical protein
VVSPQDTEPSQIDMTNREQVAKYTLQAFKNMNMQDLESVASSQ